ncbi:1-acyl-sn-glycerol-3-phosphate acyltransferase [Deinococcus soli (ex Cha et al. 2016)]|uniref:1-acyl-sn-glycerol-3-phosphate acyltransferase n=2 Tax=Deinococcus soli (ex Cha et al. 2016) TaxID=1309411 RepID=A0ACC6KFV7_9DEIO|nr:1-acyl-sn-glycerol-3-phosphate acyltransferase [Deinococcus soli (ex Cha et al. 2016)]MDR6218336.1 1-acyl-sn-glycerol-3-phosphate acyltransferase [Deinococcus soli (ex Cha et al. 2016)]MDR6329076.1 1-acyl-sn-glycerol-3-phosphate acyltransferase [Deinococcus soli (ex Cha et al. 2016)]MDR6751349.1 1-acyl-sn-glycerol-3-phosphate acyltransferase [Deinococcus soli (ex Cha et al. 2016)]
MHPLLSRLARLGLRLAGWTTEGERPDAQKYVLIAAPHTSDADFFTMVGGAWALGIAPKFMVKSSLFKGPVGLLMRALGGIPIAREARSDVVGQSCAEFARQAQLVVALLPKGTRRFTPHWKSGFYVLARRADVPVVLLSADYTRRVVRISGELTLTGEVEADMDVIRAFFAGVQGKRPEQNDVVRLASEVGE